MATREVSYRLKVDGQIETRRAFADAGKAGEAAGQSIAQSFGKAGQAADAAATAAIAAQDRQMAAWKIQAAKAREIQDAMARNARFSAMMGIGGGSGRSAADSASVFEQAALGGMTRGQRAARLNLTRQAADVFTTASMGMNPGMIAIQQGPQIMDALAQSGLKVGPAMLAAGAGVTALVASLGAGAVSAGQYEAAQAKLVAVTQGLGAASGMTAKDLEMAAVAGAKAGQIAVGAARDMAVAYGATGKIGGQVMTDLVAITKRFALTMGEDAAAATKGLAAAFADPQRGVVDLNAKLNFLNAAQQRNIELMARAGDVAGAQAAMLAALKPRLLDTAQATTTIGSAWDVVARSARNAWDWMGKAIYRGLAGDSAKDLASLQGERAAADRVMLSGAVKTRRLAELDAQIATRRGQLARASALTASTAGNAASLDIQGLVDKYDPATGQLAGLRADREKLMRSGRGDPDAARALSALNSQIAALASGYKSADAASSAFARSQRAAAADARESARDEAERARDQEDERRRAIALTDIQLGFALKIAQISGDGVDLLEREIYFRQLIAQLTAQGVSDEQARLQAATQVRKEAEAELAVKRLTPKDFVAAEDRMAAARKSIEGLDTNPLNQKMITAGAYFGDALRDGLQAAANNDSFFGAFKDRLVYTITAAFADRAAFALTEGLFGAKDGGGGGLVKTLLSAAFKSPGRNARGTNNWRGGLSWVGEEGPELLNIPAGAQIMDAAKSAQVAAGGGRAILFDLRGAVMTEDLLRQMQAMAANAGSAAEARAVSRARVQAGPAAADYLDRNRLLPTG
jgi:hypothetical protein